MTPDHAPGQTFEATETAPAKINLFLHVGGLREDGLHDLYSLFAFAGLGDIVRVRRSDSLSLSVEGPFANALAGEAVEDNLIWRAAQALASAAGIAPHAEIVLEKRLPVAAGIGGGSADAAAALRALIRLWDARLAPKALDGLAFRLGADVPACLGFAPVIVEGAGERISPAPAPPPPLHVVLANPRAPTPTGPVFRAFDAAVAERGLPGPLQTPPPVAGADWFDYLATARNDLEAPAVALEPRVGEVLTRLRAAPECRLARMSGSGATCFALCSDAADAAALARRLAEERPGWWIAPTRLLTGNEPPPA